MSFNPSVGILFCRTRRRKHRSCVHGLFQSLGRDSVLSNSTPPGTRPTARSFQSLGRDSVLSNHAIPPFQKQYSVVSIPRSGFCFVEPQPPENSGETCRSFNPSVGILFCRTLTARTIWRICCVEFQSLGRDSVLSNFLFFLLNQVKVEFQSLGRDSVLSNSGGVR